MGLLWVNSMPATLLAKTCKQWRQSLVRKLSLPMTFSTWNSCSSLRKISSHKVSEAVLLSTTVVWLECYSYFTDLISPPPPACEGSNSMIQRTFRIYICVISSRWCDFPSVLQHCWLGIREGIWPARRWVFVGGDDLTGALPELCWKMSVGIIVHVRCCDFSWTYSHTQCLGLA